MRREHFWFLLSLLVTAMAFVGPVYRWAGEHTIAGIPGLVALYAVVTALLITVLYFWGSLHKDQGDANQR